MRQTTATATATDKPVYDYTNQAWTVDGQYVRCGHPESMNCTCYGKLHAGEIATGTTINTNTPKNREEILRRA